MFIKIINKIIYMRARIHRLSGYGSSFVKIVPDQALRLYLISYSLMNLVVPIRDCVLASNTFTIYVPGIHPVASPCQ